MLTTTGDHVFTFLFVLWWNPFAADVQVEKGKNAFDTLRD